MRVSDFYNLSGTQGTFDFIDVDVDRDTPLFIDPSVLAHMSSPWALSCVSAIQTFFQAVLDRIIAKDQSGAKALLSHLGEENATHLGYSRTSRGSGLGVGLATRFYQELSTSAAVQSGLITDIEDTALLVVGVREDRVSDVVTNVIRRQLVQFTQQTARFHGIPLEQGVAVGPYWDSHAKRWLAQTFELPVTGRGPLILVPKAIVRRSLFLSPDEYYRHYVLEYFKDLELSNINSPLVYLLKSGERRVRKVDVEAKVRARNRGDGAGIEKRVNIEGTQQRPQLLESYKNAKRDTPATPPSHDAIADATGTHPPDLTTLLADVVSLAPGDKDAYDYERAVEALLGALLYPSLSNPIRQERIHQDRKRIDISFSNTGEQGDFFYWLGLHYPAASVIAECKNYGRPLGNPEYDQIAGRFSPSRGKVGLLVYRSIEDRAKMFASCKDTATDDRGYILALDDGDLTKLVDEAQTTGTCRALGGLLHQRFKALIS